MSEFNDKDVEHGGGEEIYYNELEVALISLRLKPKYVNKIIKDLKESVGTPHYEDHKVWLKEYVARINNPDNKSFKTSLKSSFVRDWNNRMNSTF